MEKRDIKVNINGTEHACSVETRVNLADFLRHQIGLTGTPEAIREAATNFSPAPMSAASMVCAAPAPCWSRVSRCAPA